MHWLFLGYNLIKFRWVLISGSVGTPTSFFFEQIAKCQLPASLIKKLGLKFPKQRTNRRYGNVPFDYNDQIDCKSANKEALVDNKASTHSGIKLKSVDTCRVKELRQKRRVSNL